MNIQANVENAIHMLVKEFIDEPYRFFTEADAVARFHQILESDPLINKIVKTKDEFPTPIIHQEFPTFFRFRDAEPLAILDPNSKARRGHYDIVILNPDFVKAHSAETVKNRSIKNIRDKNILPFKAVIEFKLDDRGWSNGKSKGAIAEMDKLIRSQDEADLRYFVSLMRYSVPAEKRWTKYWPEVEKASEERLVIRSVFATYRTLIKQTPHVKSFGGWLFKYEDKYPMG